MVPIKIIATRSLIRLLCIYIGPILHRLGAAQSTIFVHYCLRQTDTFLVTIVETVYNSVSPIKNSDNLEMPCFPYIRTDIVGSSAAVSAIEHIVWCQCTIDYAQLLAFISSLNFSALSPKKDADAGRKRLQPGLHQFTIRQYQFRWVLHCDHIFKVKVNEPKSPILCSRNIQCMNTSSLQKCHQVADLLSDYCVIAL